ncbi:MAG: TIR domain-containing protein [Dysgonamonadaceae bacterium]|jgi:predicted GTPase|nr:TIR domain-containing protein [Dysgonamonadaceae bacterium]
MKIKGFLSYSTQDDKFFQRKDITKLKKNIEDCIQKACGRKIHIFQYAENMQTGQSLTDELKREMKEASFFIPIITPSYFTSEPCRNELEYYTNCLRKDSRRIFPIYLTDINPNIAVFDEDAAKLYGKYCKKDLYYCDLRGLSISKTNSKYEKKIKGLAEDICKFLNPLLLRELTELEKKSREPSILICGLAGVGKTTTINTFFGEKVGNVGHTERGTDELNSYRWKSEGGNIIFYDVPGLGDDKNEEYKKIYIDVIKNNIDAVIIVSPLRRPIPGATIDSAELLIKNNFAPDKIIFGCNQVSDIHYDDNGETLRIKAIESLNGPTDEKEKKVIEKAMDEFYKNLTKRFPDIGFKREQFIEYDSFSGWNFFKMFNAIAKVVPDETALKLLKAVKIACKKIEDKQNKKKQEKEKEKAKIKADSTITEEEKDRKIKKIEKDIKEIGKEVYTFNKGRETLFDNIIAKVSDWVERTSETISDLYQNAKNWFNDLWV